MRDEIIQMLGFYFSWKQDSKLRKAVLSKEVGDLTFMKQHFIGEL